MSNSLAIQSWSLRYFPNACAFVLRRALQFVYVPAAAGRITPAERLAVFGSEGKDVTC